MTTMKNRSLLELSDLTPQEIRGLLDLAAAFKGEKKAGTRHPRLAGKNIVLIFEKDGRRAILTGDAGAAAEDDLRHARVLSPVDLLKVGHHGSRGATTAAFLDEICPRLAVLSCGRENRFGHPAPEALASLSARRVRLYRTDLLSDVRVELAPSATRLTLRGLR